MIHSRTVGNAIKINYCSTDFNQKEVKTDTMAQKKKSKNIPLRDILFLLNWNLLVSLKHPVSTEKNQVKTSSSAENS